MKKMPGSWMARTGLSLVKLASEDIALARVGGELRTGAGNFLRFDIDLLLKRTSFQSPGDWLNA